MRLPTSNRGRGSRGGDERPIEGDRHRSSGTGLARKVLVATALAALAYLVSRRMRSGEPVPWADEEGGESGDRGSGGGVGASAGGPSEEGDGDERPAGTASGVDPTLEEVDERVEEGVGDKPAEPGEVAVSEDVAEEARAGEPGEQDAADVGGGSGGGAGPNEDDGPGTEGDIDDGADGEADDGTEGEADDGAEGGADEEE